MSWYKQEHMKIKKKMVSKKGQQMTLGTIIAIVLGIAVLVFLIFGFSTGWSNLWDRVTNFAGGSANVDTIKQACALACAGQNTDAFCNLERTVKFGREVEVPNGDGTQRDEDGVPIDAMKKIKSATGTCQQIVENPDNFPGVGISPCPNLC